MDDVLIILGMMLVTFGARYPILVLVGRVELPERVIQALRYVPVAVLTAITVPATLMSSGEIDIHPQNAYLYAGIISAFISWRTKNLLLTIGLGMGIFLIWRALL